VGGWGIRDSSLGRMRKVRQGRAPVQPMSHGGGRGDWRGRAPGLLAAGSRASVISGCFVAWDFGRSPEGKWGEGGGLRWELK